ncbi:MAG: 2-oxo-4-hydroxy-4-carboxy-5-ureidoimidazoline decarboxylase [Gammaproteobacteria bacterium]|nr:MAG: 2-oxo-4-hydroxy-4-carboxy-5-ureidoimidazoline decarboxylase [Gammaproteobacteria bacterium]
MTSKISLANLNLYDREQFVESLGGIFEHSPWVADLVYDCLPFNSTAQLHQCMVETVEKSPEFQRMALICNHPELAGKEADAGTLTDDSRQEQSRAGLDQCSADELVQLQSLNQAYRDKFEFPFVIAVTGLNKNQIIEAVERRLQNTVRVEFDTSIAEIGKIGKIRLDALLDE